MKFFRFFILSFFILAFPLISQEDLPIEISINENGEEWVKSYEGNLDTLSIIQFVPRGENLQNWTKLINIISYKGVNDSPSKMFAMMKEELKTRIPDKKIEFNVISEEPDSIFAEWWINENSAVDEHSWIKIMRGKNQSVTLLYTIKNINEVPEVRKNWEETIRNAKIK